jgi:hypothetical protein
MKDPTGADKCDPGEAVPTIAAGAQVSITLKNLLNPESI